MPFVLTCDSCAAKLRTPNAPPAGRKVTCPKCGAAFVVSAGNCAEVPAPKPAAPAFEVVEDEPAPKPVPAAKAKPVPVPSPIEPDEDEDDRPKAKAKRRADDDEDERPRSKGKRRDEDEDDEDDRPRTKSKAKGRRNDEDEDDRPRKKNRKAAGGSGGKIALIAGGGVLLLALVAVGVYFATRDGSGDTASTGGGDGKGGTPGPGGTRANESALNARPRRELPKDVFMYWPSQKHSLQFRDFTVAGTTAKPSLGSEARDLGVKPDDVAQSLYCSESGADSVVALVLKAPVELSKRAEAAGWKELKVAGGTAYKHGTFGSAVFQPKPTVLVAVLRIGNPVANAGLIEELMARTPGSEKIPDGLWAMLQEVSGYEQVGGRVPGPGAELIPVNAKFRVDGDATTDTHRELFTGWEYASEAEAKKAEAAFKQVDATLGAKLKRDVRYEVIGPRVYRIIRNEKTPPK